MRVCDLIALVLVAVMGAIAVWVVGRPVLLWPLATAVAANIVLLVLGILGLNYLSHGEPLRWKLIK